jgi:hypothetical protein
MIDQVLPNPLGAVPIVPMVNRGRLLNRSGRSELASIAPIADGINKLATDMMVTSEFFRRRAGGDGHPDPGGPGGPRAAAGRYAQVLGRGDQVQDVAGRLWRAVRPVPGGDLDGFVSGIRLLTSALARSVACRRMTWGSIR